MAKSSGGTRGGSASGKVGAGGFTGAAAKQFGERIGTTGQFQAMGLNGRRGWDGDKTYTLYVEGEKGSGEMTFKSSAEGNKIMKQLQNNGFSFFKGYEYYFNE